jgi:pimeloyl-ACP methyl ester carboxylesterase
METVTSRDGTTIAFDRLGAGPAVIPVGGALSTRSHPAVRELAERLAQNFTVLNYDRRGRGDSGDTTPYAVTREIEDLAALIEVVGGKANLCGFSSGAVLALDAANALPGGVEKLTLYEPPFIVDDSRPPVPDDFLAQLNALIAEGRRGEAVEFFLTTAVRVPAEVLAAMKDDPSWPALEDVAHTLAYDSTIVGETMSGKPLPADRWAAVTAPTLVIVGGESEAFFHNGAQALVEILPNAQLRTLEGQAHNVAAEAIAPLLVEFFNA